MVYILRLSDERARAFGRQARTGSTVEPIKSSAKVSNEMVLILSREQFTHRATGESAQRRLTLSNIRAFPRPIPFLELPALIPRRLVTHAIRVIHAGGRLPPKTGEAIRAALAHVFPAL
jgi:hypothetical protein